MGEARRRRAAEGAGTEVSLPPRVRKVTWSFELQPEGYDTFKKVHAYMMEKDSKVPSSEDSFAAGLLTIGLKALVAKIAAEEKNKTVQVFMPGDMAEAARRLQALKERK